MRLGSTRKMSEVILASVPGTMIILFFNVLCTATSPTLCGPSAIFIPNHPSFSLVVFIISGLVKTGPGQRQLTLICFFFNWYRRE